MACNFIVGINGDVRLTSYYATKIYDIGEIHFYIPATLVANKQVFLVLKNTNKVYDIVELAQAKINSSNGANLLYKVTLDSKIRVNNELITMYLMLIDRESGECQFSAEKQMNINTEKYSLARQVYIASQVSNKIAEYYAKISAMTNENKEIYEKIQKGDK